MARSLTSVRFLLSSNPSNLAEALAAHPATATVEAEYGGVVVEGSVKTLAHHGPRKDNPCPCLEPNNPVDVDVVGLSHFDLDTLGGCAALIGCKPDGDGFWQLAAFVDVKGSHRIEESGAATKDVKRLYAFQAWAERNPLYAPRDGTVIDVTEQVMEGMEVLRRVMADDPELIREGVAFLMAESALNDATYVGVHQAGKWLIVVREVEDPGAFVNHLYSTPDRKVADACVALNTGKGGITVSIASPIPGVSCRRIVQSLWGPTAGGHDSIAGSPRDQQMTKVDLEQAVRVTANALRGMP